MIVLQYLAFSFFPVMMAYAAVSDLMSMTISNRVSIGLVAGFAVLAPFATGMDLATFGLHAAAGAAVLGGGFVLFAFGWIGGGDAKVAAAAALWLGFGHTVEFLVWTAMVGGALTLAILIVRQRVSPALAVRFSWLFRLHDPSSGVPYGLAIAAATLIVYPDTVWVGFVAG